MKYGIMQGFKMHTSQIRYGLWSKTRGEIIAKAGKLGFQGVELVIDLDYLKDPLWLSNADICRSLKEKAVSTGVDIVSICLSLLNYQEYSPASNIVAHRKTAKKIIMNTMAVSKRIGASVILVPFFGTAKLNSKQKIELLIHEMRELSEMAEEKGICLGLETSLDASTMVPIIEAIGSDKIKIYFDTGNSAVLGYDISQEIKVLGKHIIQTHIKEEPSHYMLGKGNINFKVAFDSLEKIGFNGYLILETPSTESSVSAAVKNLSYIKKIVS